MSDGTSSSQPSMDPWLGLRQLTTARIAVGRSGGSLPTREQLAFRLDHARARDAVLAPFDPVALTNRFRAMGHPVAVAETAAGTREEYLQRPDLGRRLSADSRTVLAQLASAHPCPDLVIVVSDGLSTHAVNTHSVPLLSALLPLLLNNAWTVAPIIIARNGRVALADEIGELFQARLALIVLGERPGLGSADSLSAYFTYRPAIGKTDAERNCISNIRSSGLSTGDAAKKIAALLLRARQAGISGVALKDEESPPDEPQACL